MHVGRVRLGTAVQNVLETRHSDALAVMTHTQGLRLCHRSVERRIVANTQRTQVLARQTVIDVVHAGRGHAQRIHITDRSYAELVELAHRLEQRRIKVRFVEHNIEQDVRRLGLRQKAIGLAVVKVADKATFRRRGIAINTNRPKRGGIAPHHVHRKIRKHDWAVDIERIEAAAIRVNRVFPCRRIPTLAVNPRIVRVFGSKL